MKKNQERMVITKQRISILQDIFAICRFEKDDEIPHWALKDRFVTITRTDEELSILAPIRSIPNHLVYDGDWKCLKVEGPLELTLSGILASLIGPLAKAGIAVLAIATYDTDYFLIKQDRLELAVQILLDEGHHIAYAV
jgi:uncharacterized protein